MTINVNKISLQFDDLNEPGFLIQLERIAAALPNPHFPDPWPPPVPSATSFQGEIAAYQVLYTNAAGGHKPAIALRKTARVALTANAQKVGTYYMLVADGDASILATTGYEMHHPNVRSTVHTPLGMLTGFTVKRSVLSGSLTLHADSEPTALVYHVGIGTGDPAVEANWIDGGEYPHCNHIELTGLTPGKLYYLRIRGFNKNGNGAWTVSAGIVVV